MLVACRLAGLSALGAHCADVDAYGQMRITLELIKIEGRRNRRAVIWAN